MNTQTSGPTTDEQEPCRDKKGVYRETRDEHFEFYAYSELAEEWQAERYWGGM